MSSAPASDPAPQAPPAGDDGGPPLARRRLREALPELLYELRVEQGTPARHAVAVALGAFIGCLPLYGLHLPLCLGTAHLVRVNKLLCYLAAYINNPLTGPWITLAELELGHLVRHGTMMPLTLESARAASLWGLGADLVLGSLLVSAAAGLLSGFLTFAWLHATRVPPRVGALIESAARPYVRSGMRHWEFVRGKLRWDPVFLALLRDGIIPSGGTLFDVGCGRGILLALLVAAEKQHAEGEWPEGWPAPPHDLSLVGIEQRGRTAGVAARALGGRAVIEVGDALEVPMPACRVAFLLDGNVRLAGTTFRIAAELIDCKTGFSRWTQSFDRSIDDVFAVQSEIAGAAVSALTKAMVLAGDGNHDADNAKMPVGGTTNAAAYDAYLRGRALFNLSESEATDRAALAQFDAAIVADPEFAAAHAARSRTLIVIANFYADAHSTPAIYDQAIAAAEVSTALAPELADAHSALGLALSQGRLDIRGARAPYDRSYDLGQGDAPLIARFALYCAMTGRESEAVPAMARALELDPLNPLVHRAMGIVLYNARRYADVIPRVSQALAMNPRMGDAHVIIGNALFLLGRDQEARVEYLAETSSLVRLPGLAVIERKLGNDAAARSALDQLIAEHGDSALYQQAQVFAQWGERDSAMAVLLRARTLGDSGLIYARNDPMLDPLRQTPGFPQLLQDLGFD